MHMIFHQVFSGYVIKAHQNIYFSLNLAKNFARALGTGTECSIFSCSNTRLATKIAML